MRPERVVTREGFLTGICEGTEGVFVALAAQRAGCADVAGTPAPGEPAPGGTTVLFSEVSCVTNAVFRRSTDTFSDRPLMSMV